MLYILHQYFIKMKQWKRWAVSSILYLHHWFRLKRHQCVWNMKTEPTICYNRHELRSARLVINKLHWRLKSSSWSFGRSMLVIAAEALTPCKIISDPGTEYKMVIGCYTYGFVVRVVKWVVYLFLLSLYLCVLNCTAMTLTCIFNLYHYSILTWHK